MPPVGSGKSLAQVGKVYITTRIQEEKEKKRAARKRDVVMRRQHSNPDRGI